MPGNHGSDAQNANAYMLRRQSDKTSVTLDFQKPFRVLFIERVETSRGIRLKKSGNMWYMV